MRTFETNKMDGYRAMQYRFFKNGKISVRVVGKGSMFTWQAHSMLENGETPEEWLARTDKDVFEITKGKQ
jgi:hypothetical protein